VLSFFGIPYNLNAAEITLTVVAATHTHTHMRTHFGNEINY